MRLGSLSAVLLSGSLITCLPALAQQTSPTQASPNATTVTKQPTDGGDSPANPRATDAAAAAWRKQHIDGGDSPANPGATDASAAAWRKQHIEAFDGPNNPQSL